VPLEPATAALIEQMAAPDPVDFTTLSPVGFRRLFASSLGALDAAGAAALPPCPTEDRTIDGPGGALRLRLYHPAGAGPGAPLVVFFHGGGFVIGDLDTHDGTCRILATRTGAVVVSVDYRLAPEHRFPAALDDGVAALTWAATAASTFGADPARLAVAGDSAGGNLAAAAAQRARDAGAPALAAQALVYPVVDFTTARPSVADNGEGYLLTADAMAWFAEQYLGDAPRDDPGASPLLGRLTGLPPAVVATAEFDPLRDEGRAYAAALSGAGVAVDHLEFPGLVHGFLGLGALSPASAAATDAVWGALAARLTAPG